MNSTQRIDARAEAWCRACCSGGGGGDSVTPVVHVKGEIDAECAISFVDRISRACHDGHRVVPIVIHSTGGESYQALTMINALTHLQRTHPHTVFATIVPSHIASAASCLFACGTPGHRYMARDATIMVHDGVACFGSSNDEVNVHQASRIVTETKRIDRLLNRVMEDRCGQRRGFFDDTSRHVDEYMSARRCKKLGLCDHTWVPVLETRIVVKQALVRPSRQVKQAPLDCVSNDDDDDDDDDDDGDDDNGDGDDDNDDRYRRSTSPKKRRRVR